MNEKRYGEAIAALEALCDSFPEAHDLAELLSTCYLREGRPEEAAALLEERIAAEPRWTGFARNLGLAYLNLGRREDALRAWRSLLAEEKRGKKITGPSPIFNGTPGCMKRPSRPSGRERVSKNISFPARRS